MSDPAIVYVSGTTEAVKITSAGAIELVEVTTTYGGGSGGGGGTTLTNYSQVEALTGYPESFPNDDVTAATSAATPGSIVKRDIAGASSFSGLSIGNGTITAGTLTIGVQDGISGSIDLVNDIDGSTARIVNSNQSGASLAPPTVSGTLAKTSNTDGTPDALFNATISGTVAFGTGAAANFRTAAKVPASDPPAGGADAITNIVSLTQVEYDALTPDSTTLYVIV